VAHGVSFRYNETLIYIIITPYKNQGLPQDFIRARRALYFDCTVTQRTPEGHHVKLVNVSMVNSPTGKKATGVPVAIR